MSWHGLKLDSSWMKVCPITSPMIIRIQSSKWELRILQHAPGEIGMSCYACLSGLPSTSEHRYDSGDDQRLIQLMRCLALLGSTGVAGAAFIQVSTGPSCSVSCSNLSHSSSTRIDRASNKVSKPGLREKYVLLHSFVLFGWLKYELWNISTLNRHMQVLHSIATTQLVSLKESEESWKRNIIWTGIFVPG